LGGAGGYTSGVEELQTPQKVILTILKECNFWLFGNAISYHLTAIQPHLLCFMRPLAANKADFGTLPAIRTTQRISTIQRNK
jgi:hypothetical protein